MRRVQVHLGVRPETRARIDAAAREKRLPRGVIVDRAVRYYCERVLRLMLEDVALISTTDECPANSPG